MVLLADGSLSVWPKQEVSVANFSWDDAAK